MFSFSLKAVPTNAIDLTVDRFSCSFPACPEPLLASMERSGQLEPVTLVQNSSGFFVVSGYRRAMAARTLGLETVDSVVLEPPLPQDHLLFFRNLEVNRSIRTFNLLEKAAGLDRLQNTFQLQRDDQAWARGLELLGLTGKVREIPRYLELAQLPLSVKEYLVEKTVPESAAFTLAALPGPERALLVETARTMRLTVGQFRGLVEWGPEIAERDGTALKTLLARMASQIDPGIENDNQRREHFFHALRAQRFPDLTRALARIEALLVPINRLQGLRLSGPPSMEGDELTATIVFRDPCELAERAGKLKEFSAGDALAEAVALLR